MHIFEALQSALVTILLGYLSLTSTIADTITQNIGTLLPNYPITTTELPTASETSDAPSTELTLLSRLYASAQGTSKVLFENSAFREAARTIENRATIAVSDLTPGELDAHVTDALVNILCQYKTDAYTRTTTGTGFFIEDTGVILTNAHVAQFLLLESVDKAVRDAECIIRTGNPATPRYHAELLFISPSWIFTNAKLITAEHPSGTGEYDYALLYIADSIDDKPLPVTFPALPLHTDFLSKNLVGTTVTTAGYPAEKLTREGVGAALLPERAHTTIDELYTFGSNYADIFSIGESIVGEQGASGGPVVSDTLGTIGLIVTKGDIKTEGAKSLRALTLSYIDRTIREETGYSLYENARGDLPYRGKVFKDVLAPFLSQLLADQLKSE